MKRKLLLILLTMAMAIIMVPMATMTLYAADSGEHSHDDATFQPWGESTSLPTEEGSYYLTDDVVLSEIWKVDKNIKLCLNGHVISFSGENAYIHSKLLELYDCDKTTKHYFGDNDGLWTWNDELKGNDIKHTVVGGIITGCSCINRMTGAITIDSNGFFIMHGGNLVGNSSFTTVRMSQNSFIQRFEMHGGSIQGNKSSNIGGVLAPNGEVYLDGGIISNNSAYSHLPHSTCNGGVVIGENTKLILGGDIVIKDNKGSVNGNVCNDNLNIPADTYILLGNGENGVAAPTNNMQVGLSGYGSILKGTEADLKYFFADNDTICLLFYDDNLEIYSSWDLLGEAMEGEDNIPTNSAITVSDKENTRTIKMLTNIASQEGDKTISTGDEDIVLDLNGCVLSFTPDIYNYSLQSVLVVSENTTLEIIDSNPLTKHKGYIKDYIWNWDENVSASDAVEISGGIITGGYDAAIFLAENAKLVMKAGNITGNNGKYGIIDSVDEMNSFIMDGG